MHGTPRTVNCSMCEQFRLADILAQSVDASAAVMVAENIHRHKRIRIVCLEFLDQIPEVFGSEFEVQHFEIKHERQAVVLFFRPEYLRIVSLASAHFANR